MSKELNIGDYVRTKYGIAKIESFELKNKEIINLDKDIMFCNMDIYRNCCSINQVIKSSSNIIDLIEVGDLVKIENEGWVQVSIKFEVLKFFDNSGTEYLYEEIKGIITKEQIANMEYKIGE